MDLGAEGVGVAAGGLALQRGRVVPAVLEAVQAVAWAGMAGGRRGNARQILHVSVSGGGSGDKIRGGENGDKEAARCGQGSCTARRSSRERKLGRRNYLEEQLAEGLQVTAENGDLAGHALPCIHAMVRVDTRAYCRPAAMKYAMNGANRSSG